ncbi:MAG: branched-chain amino acid ABC transporter permease [Anaerolineales bacterium]|nr:branched-chain amino acid ABC transporter permease [Anaerolineales bacterium]
MRRRSRSPVAVEILRPFGQLFAFILITAVSLSSFLISLAFVMRGSNADQVLMEHMGQGLLGFTISNLPQVLVDGITIGFVYAAIALGYSMVYGVLEFINFAHSEIFAIGAFIGVEFLIALDNGNRLAGASIGQSYLFLGMAILGGMIIAGLAAVTVERVAYRPLRGAPRLVPLISAIGVSFFLVDAIRLIESVTTGQFYRVFPTFGNFDQIIELAHFNALGFPVNLVIQVKSLVVILAAVTMMVGLSSFVNLSKIGKAIRAVAQDRPTASLMGIDVNRIIAITFLIGGALGGAAGVLFALKFTRIDPFMGFFPGLKAFTAAVLGGIGNLVGALLGGIVLGMLETAAGAYLSAFTAGAFGAEYKDIMAFAILILVLIIRPHGLLGEQVSQKA